MEVTSVDPAQKAVVIGSTQERVAYEILVLATGGTPRKLPIVGKDLSNVFTLRGVDDAKKIDAGMVCAVITCAYMLRWLVL